MCEYLDMTPEQIERLGLALVHLDGMASMSSVMDTLSDLKADAQALADMRTLDAYHGNMGHVSPTEPWPTGGVIIYVRNGSNGVGERCVADTPEGARSKAAEWVRKNSVVR